MRAIDRATHSLLAFARASTTHPALDVFPRRSRRPATIWRGNLARVSSRARARASSSTDGDARKPSNVPYERRAATTHRFYVDEPLRGPGAVTLSREETRHASRALRLKPGDALEVCDGVGGLGIGRLGDIVGDEARVEVEAMVTEPSALASGTDWDVACAFGGLKGGRGDWLVEKCAELGARALIPLLTARSAAVGGVDRDDGRKAGRKNAEATSGRESRWGRVAHAASKQCLRVRGLVVDAPLGVKELCKLIEAEGSSRTTLLAAQGAPPLVDVARATGADGMRSGRIVIGPEGDFTDEEVEALIRAGARPIALGALRLRVETAAIAVLATVNAIVDGE